MADRLPTPAALEGYEEAENQKWKRMGEIEMFFLIYKPNFNIRKKKLVYELPLIKAHTWTDRT